MSVWKDKTSGGWRYSYRLPNTTRRKSGTNASRALAKQAHDAGVSRTWQCEHGLAETADADHASHANTPLTEHLDAYVKHLRNQQRSHDHIRTVEGRLRILFNHARLRLLRDVSPVAVSAGLASYASADNASDQTVAHAMTQLKSMLNWCVEDSRIAVNPIAKMKSPKITKQVHPRRPATAAELLKLLQAADRKSAGAWHPKDRSALMLVLAGAGLRKGDCLGLTPEAFRLDGGNPTIHVEASSTKNKEKAVQPISPQMADILRAWLAGKPANRPVFPLLTRNSRVSQMVKRCCAAAGIPYKTSVGFLDGHALRHTYGTMMAAQTKNPKNLMELMRHKDIATTMRYLHADDGEKRRMVDGMDFLNGGQS
jgi:integrase/recombinase XerC